MKRIVMTVFCLAALSTAAFAQDDHNDARPVSVGYAVITAQGGVNPFGIAGGLVAFETFAFRNQLPPLQTAVLPATLTTRTVIFANAAIRLGANVGVGITNPASTATNVTLTLRRASGAVTSTKILTIPARQQVARFISELFQDVPEVSRDFAGTLTLTSNTPVAVVALRFRGSTFSTIPITSLSPYFELPEMTSVIGGSNAVLLPQFVADGRWASEIIVLNNSTIPLTVRIDLFKQDGTPLTTTLNHLLNSSFQNIIIPPGGIIMFAPRDATGDSDGNQDQ